jgi:hypothetical protein
MNRENALYLTHSAARPLSPDVCSVRARVRAQRHASRWQEAGERASSNCIMRVNVHFPLNCYHMRRSSYCFSTTSHFSSLHFRYETTERSRPIQLNNQRHPNFPCQPHTHTQSPGTKETQDQVVVGDALIGSARGRGCCGASRSSCGRRGSCCSGGPC